MFKPVVIAILYVSVCPSALAETLRDPMRPWDSAAPVTQQVVPGKFDLNAILFADDRRVAIINGRTVGEGDRINGARVHRIYRHSLLLDSGGLLVRLKLPHRAANIRHRSR